jgi:hypothetical protein
MSVYTELGWMTDDELIRYAANKPDLTTLEMELATRFCEVLDELGEIDSEEDAECIDAAEYGLVGNS